MSAETLRQMLQQRPFVPFEVHMSNGDVYQVRYPQFAFVLRTLLVLGDPDADNIAICALNQMASINAPQ